MRRLLMGLLRVEVSALVMFAGMPHQDDHLLIDRNIIQIDSSNPAQSFTFFDFHAIPGDELATVDGPYFKNCLDQCYARDDCKAFNFEVSSGKCHLLKSSSNPVGAMNFMSAIRNGYQGSDFGQKQEASPPAVPSDAVSSVIAEFKEEQKDVASTGTSIQPPATSSVGSDSNAQSVLVISVVGVILLLIALAFVVQRRQEKARLDRQERAALGMNVGRASAPQAARTSANGNFALKLVGVVVAIGAIGAGHYYFQRNSARSSITGVRQVTPADIDPRNVYGAWAPNGFCEDTRINIYEGHTLIESTHGGFYYRSDDPSFVVESGPLFDQYLQGFPESFRATAPGTVVMIFNKNRNPTSGPNDFTLYFAIRDPARDLLIITVTDDTVLNDDRTEFISFKESDFSKMVDEARRLNGEEPGSGPDAVWKRCR